MYVQFTHCVYGVGFFCSIFISTTKFKFKEKQKLDLSDIIVWEQLHNTQKPSRYVLIKRCYQNMQQIYWRTPIPKCDFNKVAKHTSLGVFSAVNLLHSFRTPFSKNTYGGLLLNTPILKRYKISCFHWSTVFCFYSNYFAFHVTYALIEAFE